MQTVTISTAILRGAVKTAYTKYLEDYDSALTEYNTHCIRTTDPKVGEGRQFNRIRIA